MTNVRAEASTGKVVWTFGGSSYMNGLALGGDGAVTTGVRPSGTKKGELTRIDPKTGRVALLDGKGMGRVVLDLADDVVGLAELDGKVYVSDTKANKVWIGPADGSRWDGAIDVPAPRASAADHKTRVVWVIAAGKAASWRRAGRSRRVGVGFLQPRRFAAAGGEGRPARGQ